MSDNPPIDLEQADMILNVIRSWHRPEQLAQFAVDRRGYGNTDGGFGMHFPESIDDYEREVEGHLIPHGQVEIYGFWGKENGGYEFTVPEAIYLTILADFLKAKISFLTQ